MRLFSYVVARDYGFAPNPFGDYCTLCTCKPEIRRLASVGDWILGTGSKTRGRQDHAVFMMCVSEALTFDQYWADERFRRKRPNLRGSKKQAFGDNIYFRESGEAPWQQLDSHHSLSDGSPNDENIAHDTRVNRVLVSDDFAYWGGMGPALPASLMDPKRLDVRAGRGRRSRFADSEIERVVTWFRDRSESGYLGAPLDWVRSP